MTEVQMYSHEEFFVVHLQKLVAIIIKNDRRYYQ